MKEAKDHDCWCPFQVDYFELHNIKSYSLINSGKFITYRKVFFNFHKPGTSPSNSPLRAP